MNDSKETLPVEKFLGEITEAFISKGTLILQAEPGAGKTTMVPTHLLSHNVFGTGKMLLLQPRRIAARAAAERISSLIGEPVGKRVGLRTRLETIVSKDTLLEVVTEGILTRIIQNDQSLEGYSAVIFDEFHERSLSLDLGLSLTHDCREALRPDLKIMIMSATIDPEEIRAFLGDVPVISVPGRTYPVDVQYRPKKQNEKIWDGAARLVREAFSIRTDGDILVFLPGFREIRRTHEILISDKSFDADIIQLHGQLPIEEQRKVLNLPNGRRRIILSTNVAETSLTIPGVKTVVDSGLARRVRFSQRTGMDHWDTSMISLASADQRKGRAGRLGPGLCLRWWNEHENLEPFSAPEITEADLAPLVLECSLWGTSEDRLAWITPPPNGAVRRARELLLSLALIDEQGAVTLAGKKSASLGLHPRISRMVLSSIDKDLLDTAVLSAAILENGDPLKTNDCDFTDRLSAWNAWKSGSYSQISGSAAKRIDEETKRILRATGQGRLIDCSKIIPQRSGELLLLAYPERLARRTRQSGDTARYTLALGRGAVAKGSIVREEFIVVPEIDGGETDARIFLAAAVSRTDLESGLAGDLAEKVTISWNDWKREVRTELVSGGIVLKEHTGGTVSEEELQKAVETRISREGLSILPWSDSTRSFLARCRFIERRKVFDEWPDFSESALVQSVSDWLIPFGKWDDSTVFNEDSLQKGLEFRLGWNNLQKLSAAPEQIELPSGSKRTIDYESDPPVLAARLQEFFGCIETPSVCNEPLMLHLLSPAGRPVQVTRDLGGFWERAYPEVKKELMGRYPRHYWPDNPREAEPTARVKPRK